MEYTPSDGFDESIRNNLLFASSLKMSVPVQCPKWNLDGMTACLTRVVAFLPRWEQTDPDMWAFSSATEVESWGSALASLRQLLFYFREGECGSSRLRFPTSVFCLRRTDTSLCSGWLHTSRIRSSVTRWSCCSLPLGPSRMLLCVAESVRGRSRLLTVKAKATERCGEGG